MKEVIKNIFDKVDFGIIVGTIYLASVVFVLIPKNIMEYLKLLEFKEKWQFVISIIFVILTCYYFSLLIKYIFAKIQKYRFKETLKKLMGNITAEEKQYLMMFYDSDNKKFKTSQNFDMTDAIVNLLVTKNIIAMGSTVSKGLTVFDYFLQPWAYEYLAEELEKGNIEVTKDSFTW